VDGNEAEPAKNGFPLSRLLSSSFAGAADHPLAQADQRILMPARHGVGQLAKLNGEPVQILAL
jgi:hypothetical protein